MFELYPRGLTALALACIALVAPLAATDDTVPADPDAVDPDVGQHYRYLERFSPFEPMYYAVGWREQTNARFQFSFRYRFVNPEGALAQSGNWFSRLHFGYTQMSLWDLEAESRPFLDTSYEPSLFFLHDRVGWLSSSTAEVGLQTGYEHESNGQDGDDSRAVNTLYLRPIVRIPLAGGHRLVLAPKLLYYIGTLADNPDIADYRGYVELEATFAQRNGWQLAAALRHGTEGGAGSVQLDLSYPLDHFLGGSFDAFVQLQYFAGWGESLANYDRKLPSQIRLGIMLVR